ncbi:MAG: hypothetical protein RMI74_05660 [Thermodesulfobacterium sp.]|nr:hypothetical protein [Thermodesulfobacterium sp.]
MEKKLGDKIDFPIKMANLNGIFFTNFMTMLTLQTLSKGGAMILGKGFYTRGFERDSNASNTRRQTLRTSFYRGGKKIVAQCCNKQGRVDKVSAGES